MRCMRVVSVGVNDGEVSVGGANCGFLEYIGRDQLCGAWGGLKGGGFYSFLTSCPHMWALINQHNLVYSSNTMLSYSNFYPRNRLSNHMLLFLY